MILVVLIRFLHTTPDFLNQLFDLSKIFIDTQQIETIINSLLTVKKIGMFEIVIAFFILWMSKGFFFSTMKGIHHIFHEQVKPKPLISNVFNIAAEIVFVITLSVAVFSIVTIRKLLSSSLLDSYMSQLMINTFEVIFKFLPEILMFIIITAIYHYAPGTKPKWKICSLSSFFCTVIFWIIQKALSLFLNFARYNFIYGVMGNLIVVLMEVNIFFYLFFFFAQYIYTYQFFDTLVLAELYLQQSKETTSILATLRKTLFTHPDNVLTSDCSEVELKADQNIYVNGNTSNEIYYIIQGSVKLTHLKNATYFERGSFFGEIECIMNQPRASAAKCVTDTRLLKISLDKFTSIIETNPEVARKIISLISVHFSKIYGRSDEFLVE